MQPLRGLVFSVMASSAFYPIIIKILQVGWSRADAEYGASLYALTILIYLCSVATYAVSVSLRPLLDWNFTKLEILALLISFIMKQLRLTESWKPGYFDIWGHSHQIFHVGMAIGLTVHFLAFARALDQFYTTKKGQCLD